MKISLFPWTDLNEFVKVVFETGMASIEGVKSVLTDNDKSIGNLGKRIALLISMLEVDSGYDVIGEFIDVPRLGHAAFCLAVEKGETVYIYYRNGCLYLTDSRILCGLSEWVRDSKYLFCVMNSGLGEVMAFNHFYRLIENGLNVVKKDDLEGYKVLELSFKRPGY